MCVCVCVCESVSRIRLFVIPWIVACQTSLSLGFSRQEYWSELPFPSPGDIPDPGIKPGPPALQADGLLSEPLGKPNCATLLSVISHSCSCFCGILCPRHCYGLKVSRVYVSLPLDFGLGHVTCFGISKYQYLL